MQYKYGTLHKCNHTFVCIDLKDVSTSSQDATLELLDGSQSMDATVSLDMIGETVPQSFPADDSEFNLHLSNTTTATQCSAASQELGEVRALLKNKLQFVVC